MNDPLKRMAFAALASEDGSDAPGAEVRACDWEHCEAEGLHPAPKSRSRLQDRYWFCKEHARAYNRAWNYYAGMSADEIERERRKDTIWQRPTWPFSNGVGLVRSRVIGCRAAVSAAAGLGLDLSRTSLRAAVSPCRH